MLVIYHPGKRIRPTWVRYTSNIPIRSNLLKEVLYNDIIPDGSPDEQFEKSIWASIRLLEQYKILLKSKKDEGLGVEQQLAEIDINIRELKSALQDFPLVGGPKQAK
jgi:hypothetical protein